MTGTSMLSKFRPRLGTACLSLLCIWASGFSTPSWSTPYFPEKYDAEIQSAVHKYWPDLPVWKLAKSQLYAESRLDPTVCSTAGACGIAQFLGPTWSDVINRFQWDPSASRFDARLAIQGFAFYSAQLRGKWKPEGRRAHDRNDLQAASYNAGIGHVIKAQSLCADARLWAAIAPCMIQVTGEHAAETLNYVQRINSFWQQMEQAP